MVVEMRSYRPLNIGRRGAVAANHPLAAQAGLLALRAGGAIIEITKLRVPCSTLDVYGPTIKQEIYDPKVKAGDHTSPRWARGGFYARVLKPGLVISGAPMTLLSDCA